PIKEGTIDESHIYAELAEIVSGAKKGRTSDEEITLFKSVGLAIEDTIIAKLAYEEAVKRGIGKEVEL
ncbi:MAG TPA: ornithine cyclodeaminase, partial [Thermococcus paralvinellae]|nr:ornithine cyclodeaminase [Thermococcus paralvinellae]